LLNSEKNYFLFINYIRNTFINWKYSPISYCINHFLDGYTYYQIYSISFNGTKEISLSKKYNSFTISIVKKLQFCFQFVYNLFTSYQTEQAIELFPTPFYVEKKKNWFLFFYVYYYNHKRLIIFYSIPIIFDQLTFI
jgi:hypothetical protein